MKQILPRTWKPPQPMTIRACSQLRSATLTKIPSACGVPNVYLF
jgi:hypothetical protein